MSTASAPTRLPHSGELSYQLALNDFPPMAFRHYVTATAVSPDECHVALAIHSGEIMIVHRSTPETEQFSWYWSIQTGISYPRLVALSVDAAFCMVLDNDDRIRIFSRHSNRWAEESVRRGHLSEIGLYSTHYSFSLMEHELCIARKKNRQVVHRFVRRRRWWSNAYCWVRVSADSSMVA